MHLQPVFAGAEMHGGQISERLFEDGLCLPSGAGLSSEDRDRVIATFTKAFAR
jgi:dTDP-4-amino-4,6-dideoxygalactose transaminase